MMNLTENEKALLKGGCDSEYNDMCEDDGMGGFNGTWMFDAIHYSKLDSKIARGVVSSLVKKGLVVIVDNEGRGKANDMAIIPTKEGYGVCVELGYTK